jgi:hypothetical protein
VNSFFLFSCPPAYYLGTCLVPRKQRLRLFGTKGSFFCDSFVWYACTHSGAPTTHLHFYDKMKKKRRSSFLLL